MACITESGRVVDASGDTQLELADGSWIKAWPPLSREEIMNARVISDEELRIYMERYGKPCCAE